LAKRRGGAIPDQVERLEVVGQRSCVGDKIGPPRPPLTKVSLGGQAEPGVNLTQGSSGLTRLRTASSYIGPEQGELGANFCHLGKVTLYIFSPSFLRIQALLTLVLLSVHVKILTHLRRPGAGLSYDHGRFQNRFELWGGRQLQHANYTNRQLRLLRFVRLRNRVLRLH
jgi:hypothetical protein